MDSVNSSINRAKESGFGGFRYTDIHCHCLPAVDDGPATLDEAIALCEVLVEDGATTVIATPHQLGRFSDCNEAAQIRDSVCALNAELKNNNIPLTVAPGGDIRVDERICRLLDEDKILTLADGGKYILLELPHEILIDIEPLLIELSSVGIQPIISHPERHSILVKESRILLKWLEHPVLLQVTAGSLLGEFGPVAEGAAWHFLSSGWASLIATDSHDLDGRRPRMRGAFENICFKLGETTACSVCIENPLKVLRGQDVTTGRRVYSDERMPRVL